MERIVYDTLLYDFYNELLTDRQRTVFEMHFLNDLSLQEIANEFGISRQAVSDIIRRTGKLFTYYEEKLALVNRHITDKALHDSIINSIDQLIHNETISVSDIVELRNKILLSYDQE